jgi:hypothetical protein
MAGVLDFNVSIVTKLFNAFSAGRIFSLPVSDGERAA